SLPWARYYRLLASRLPAAVNHKDLMQGIELTPGGIARRSAQTIVELSPEMEKTLREERNLHALAETTNSPLTDPNKLLAQGGPMLKKLPDERAAAATFQLANQYVRLGQWTLARELFLQIIDRYPAHPLCADAYRWLIRHNSSSEVRRRQELGQFWMVSQSRIQLTGGADQERAKLARGLSSEALLLEN